MRTFNQCVLLLLFLLLSKITLAQELTITGKVTSSTNEPLQVFQLKLVQEMKARVLMLMEIMK